MITTPENRYPVGPWMIAIWGVGFLHGLINHGLLQK